MLERLAERGYAAKAEQEAFKIGYRRGFEGKPRVAALLALKDYPCAYNAGYHEGHGDSGRLI